MKDMLIPKNKPLRDKKWLKQVREIPCIICGSRQGSDPAHIRHGLGGGIGIKPSDDLVVPLCHEHHMQQHKDGEKTFWSIAFSMDRDLMMLCLKAYAQQLYQRRNQ